jgi:major membrane immunogen (membrane-anchored lipoprotein)
MMKKYQLSCLVAFFTLAVLVTACSKKNYSSNNVSDTAVPYENSKKNIADYTPPQVIVVADEKAKANKEGELYFDDEHGYRYWRNCDGKYYLDAKYERGATPKKKYTKKSSKKQPKENPQEDYVGQ